jgi:hypothetical protein
MKKGNDILTTPIYQVKLTWCKCVPCIRKCRESQLSLQNQACSLHHDRRCYGCSPVLSAGLVGAFE